MKRKNAFTLVELLVVIAIVGILISVTIPATNKAMGRARRMQCASNLRQLSSAVLIFCKDNRGTFPALQNTGTGEQWTSLISSYITKGYSGSPTSPAKDRPVFFCPEALKHHRGTYETAHGSYGINESLMEGGYPDWTGKKIQSFAKTSRIVLLGDGRWLPSDDWWGAGLNFEENPPFLSDDDPDSEKPTEERKTFVHGKGANFVFLDGHTEWLEYSNYLTNSVMWTGQVQ